MASVRTYRQTVCALLLGLVGLCASSAVAQAHQRLLFLGISQNGHPFQPAESAIKLRLSGFDVTVAGSSELIDSPCERANCLLSALSSQPADFALTGRILKNEHACLATLWLAAGPAAEQITERDVACRSDAKDNELVENLTDAASAMVDAYLKGHEPPEAATTAALLTEPAPSPILAEPPKKWSWKRKLAAAGLGTLLGLGIGTVAYFATKDKQAIGDHEPCLGSSTFTCQKIFDFSTQITLSAALTASSAAALITIMIK